RPGTDRISVDGDRAEQRVADLAHEPAEPDVRSERGRGAHGPAVVQHVVLPAADGRRQRRADRERAARPGAGARLQPHRSVVLQELRNRRLAAGPAAGRGVQHLQPGALRPAERHDWRADLRADHSGGRWADRAAGAEVHVLTAWMSWAAVTLR